MAGSILAVDIGTTRTKYRFETSQSAQEAWLETGSPTDTVRLIRRLRDRYRPTVTAIASYRRAALDSEAHPILVRDLDASPPSLHFPGTDAGNPFATLHRWRPHPVRGTAGWFSFDAWLAQQLTDLAAVAPSMAWLSGAWNLDTKQFDPSVLSMLKQANRLPDLPEVLDVPTLVGGVLLPILGDHEATAISAFAARGELNVVECGTAWASLVQVQEDLSSALGLDAPQATGYRETIDPFLVAHLAGTTVQDAEQRWQGSPIYTSDTGNVLDALASHHLSDARDLESRPIVIGGNAERFLSRLNERLRREFEFVAGGISPLDGLIRLARRTLT